MDLCIEEKIKNEICRFNDALWGLINTVDHKLELDKETFTIIENSNKLLVFCAVKDFERKKEGDPVGVVYDEKAVRRPEDPPVYYGRSFAQYRKVYENSDGRCRVICKKEPDSFFPETTLWYYKINGHVIYERKDGSFGVSRSQDL